MAHTSLLRASMATCVSILAVQPASAQNVSPTNDTSSINSTTQFTMDTVLEMTPARFALIPLTPQAGLGQESLDQLRVINPQGPLYLTNTTSVANLQDNNIAYLSCEPGDYAQGAIDATGIIDLAAKNKPDAIVFYSIYAARCDFSAASGFTYSSMYSMITANASVSVLAGLLKNDPSSPNSKIYVNQNSLNDNGSGNDNGAGGNVLGKSPTTAVAMIILYSITGIITALFLAIIVVGAVRAHRHPERYGPRRVMGRPRQSRARGIARAMLETLPIVKFGDKEDDKPGETGRDVELANTEQATGATNVERSAEHPDEQAMVSAHAPAENGPDVVTTVAAAETAQMKGDASDPVNAAENGLACSVCTDDFVKGQDIRVLPCQHKFHPECIDPWLLNVSGTCPLCRVDLHPTSSHDPGAEDEEFDDGPSLETRVYRDDTQEMPPAESARRNRRSRILHTLNIGRMRHATPEERIAALRRLRNENEASDSIAEQGGRVGNRFSRRFSRAFGGSHGGSRRASVMNNSRPVSEIPHAAVEPATPTMAEMAPPTVEATAPARSETISPTADAACPTPTETAPPPATEASSHLAVERASSTAAVTAPRDATEPTSHTAAGASPPGSADGSPRDMSTWYGYR